MAKGKLTSSEIAGLNVPGLYPDGDGLYLQVTGPQSKSWLYRYQLRGKARALGLGSARDVTPAGARTKRDKARVQVKEGIDVVAQRREDKEREKAAGKRGRPFIEFAERYIADRRKSWSNEKHATQWENTLRDYAYPVIGQVAIEAIDAPRVLQVLKPIWASKTETASRLRGRIEAILDAARAEGLREGENPARWHGHLSHSLPARSTLKAVKHHAALPYADIPAFFCDLDQQEGVAARALAFTILTAARTSEATGATVAEIDTEQSAWTIPAERMKAGRAHRVPLSAKALAILAQIPDIDGKRGFLFPGGRAHRPLSNMAMAKVLERMDRAGITVHGFRSSFRDWAAERTNFPSEVAEAALAHVVGDKVEAAYRRGDLFDKRRKLMDAWAAFCDSASAAGNVVPMRAG